jgi:hypothetical protein
MIAFDEGIRNWKEVAGNECDQIMIGRTFS